LLRPASPALLQWRLAEGAEDLHSDLFVIGAPYFVSEAGLEGEAGLFRFFVGGIGPGPAQLGALDRKIRFAGDDGDGGEFFPLLEAGVVEFGPEGVGAGQDEYAEVVQRQVADFIREGDADEDGAVFQVLGLDDQGQVFFGEVRAGISFDGGQGAAGDNKV